MYWSYQVLRGSPQLDHESGKEEALTGVHPWLRERLWEYTKILFISSAMQVKVTQEDMSQLMDSDDLSVEDLLELQQWRGEMSSCIESADLPPVCQLLVSDLSEIL